MTNKSSSTRYLTPEEVRAQFFAVLWRTAYLTISASPTQSEAVLSTITNILAMIDGEDNSLPALLLAPCPDAIDKTHFAEGRGRPFPENDPTLIHCNLSGNLAEQFSHYCEVMAQFPSTQGAN